LADHMLALDGLMRDRVFLGEGARLAVFEVAEDFRDFADVVRIFLLVGWVADAATFVAKAFFHLNPKLASIDELHLTLTGLFLPFRNYQQIGKDAVIVEELLGRRDNGSQPVFLNDPAADFAFPSACVAGEQRRAVKNDGKAAAAVLLGPHL